MKTETQIEENEEVKSVIDTSKMSKEQREVMELTESARESGLAEDGFAGGLFMGRFNLPALHPYPLQSADQRANGDVFLKKLEQFLQEKVDPDEIDRTGEIPQEIFDGLAKLGAFGIKIPRKYGGLELSQTNYCRAGMLLGSYCGNLTALISAHQSIGVPQPLIMFGTDAQKQQFLPKIANGEVSAFALTEVKVGSDPGRMETHAEPTEDGEHFILNGEKLWCTNSVKAGVIVVMAKTPPQMVYGKSKNQITAFVVEMDTPGVEVVRRCHFMGLRALYNGVVRFTDVKVPRENIVMAEGKGLRVALTTLNTGRLTLPAACVGLSKRCLQICREWANERVQWGAPIGKHAAIADKIARMAANTFTLEAMTFYTTSLVDHDKKADIRLEAAMCKLWGTERTWETVDATMQIRGGRGYEKASSLLARGEKPIAVERFMRDSRINLIFEGSSEIMRLFIAREALDPHLKIGAPMMNSQLPVSERIAAAMKAAAFYARWYPKQWSPLANFENAGDELNPLLARALRFARRASRKLARRLFHAIAIYGPKLEREQLLLGRVVDIGTELFAISATCARAQALLPTHENPKALLQLVEFSCKQSALRIESLFTSMSRNADKLGYKLAQEVLEKNYEWLETGIVGEPVR